MVPVQSYLSKKKNLKYYFELFNVFKLINQRLNDSLNDKEVLTFF